MKKIFGITIGGLQSKILRLVLILFLVTIACGSVISFYQTKYLTGIVNEATNEQQTAIADVSKKTIHEIIAGSMTKTNSLQAEILDDMFSDIQRDVTTLQSLAENLFEQGDALIPAVMSPPDAKEEGVFAAQALCENGVDYENSEYLGTAAYMSDTMIAMCENSYYMSNAYFGLADGTILCVDSHAANKYDENGELIAFPVRERPWYQNAAESGTLTFSGVTVDTYTGKRCVTCSAPVYLEQELVGVVGIDLFLDSIEQYVNASSSDIGFICIVNQAGQIVFVPENNKVFRVQDSEDAEDLRKSDNADLAALIGDALSAPTGLKTVNLHDTDYYMAGSPMKTVGWSLISVKEKSITEASTQQMLAEYDAINARANESYQSGSAKQRNAAALAILLILIVGVVSALLLAGKIVKPIESMTTDIENGMKTGKSFEMKELYRTHDEIQVLAESFDELSKKAMQYIADITAITKEKERIGTELSLATKIQASMLPHIFPPYPDRHEFDIYAMMDPAREVGGDFYDFFLIDDDHLCLVMADVSGKGIPAALFMMISKTILQSCAMLGISVSEILEKTNDALCSNNQVDMFVTVWLGILEISTGTLTAANAGHEYPALKRHDGSFEIYKDKHGLVIGGMSGIPYKEYTLQLHPGDQLFLYTDGVPEASDADDQMFGLDRMLDALNQEETDSPEDILQRVKDAVGAFVKDAEQFDDLTMLCLTYHGTQQEKEESENG